MIGPATSSTATHRMVVPKSDGQRCAPWTPNETQTTALQPVAEGSARARPHLQPAEAEAGSLAETGVNAF